MAIFFIILRSFAEGKIFENLILGSSKTRYSICEISGFRHGVVEAFTLLGCYAPQLYILRWEQQTAPKRRQPTKTLDRIISQKSEGVMLIIFSFSMLYFHLSICFSFLDQYFKFSLICRVP